MEPRFPPRSPTLELLLLGTHRTEGEGGGGARQRERQTAVPPREILTSEILVASP